MQARDGLLSDAQDKADAGIGCADFNGDYPLLGTDRHCGQHFASRTRRQGSGASTRLYPFDTHRNQCQQKHQARDEIQ